VHLAYRYLDQDTVDWALPEGFRVESMPKKVMLEETFARFVSDVSVGPDGSVRVVRELKVTEPVVSSERYEAYRAFFQTVVKADRAQLVLVRQSNR
jgi:hypothetical protein